MEKPQVLPIDCITPEAGSAEADAMTRASRAEPHASSTVAAIVAEPMHTAPIHTEPIVAGSDQGSTRHDKALSRAEGGHVSGTEALAEVSTEAIYRELLGRLGEDPARDGLVRTPERVERAMRFLTQGYSETISSVLHDALFDVDYDEMVIVRDVEFYSLCEHHLLPFYGKAHIAYIPQGRVVGLSKIPRLVDMFARRLQVQERLTRQIAEGLIEAIQPQGVGVILEAQHLCMMMRGVEKQHSLTTTSAMLGVFRSQVQTRNEFLSLVRRPGASL